MQYEIEIGRRTRHVTVSRAGAAFAVTVDGHTRHVDAVCIDGHTLSLILDNVWSKDAVVIAHPATGDDRGVGAPGVDRGVGAPGVELTVSVDGVPVSVVLNGRRRGRRDEAKGSGPDRPERLIAPMPGKIIRVLVKAGDSVAARQPLVVVEAMKMENELRAGRDGAVAEVHAREGESVDRGALLIVIQ